MIQLLRRLLQIFTRSFFDKSRLNIGLSLRGISLSDVFDTMAITEVAKLVEPAFRSKEALKDSLVANSQEEILDIFVRAGWQEALHRYI